MTGSSRSRSNSKRLSFEVYPPRTPDRLFLLFERTHEVPSRELLDASTGTDVVVPIIPPTADTLRTVKSSRSRSNSNEYDVEFSLRSNGKGCYGRHFLPFEGYYPRTPPSQTGQASSCHSYRSRSGATRTTDCFLLFEDYYPRTISR